MQVTYEQVEALEALQDIDLKIVRAKKELDNLAEKQQIFDLRQKKTAIMAKRKSVLELKDIAITQVSRLEDDIANIERMIIAAQAHIESSKGDFRRAGSASKELEGHVKHLDDLQEQFETARKRSADANEVLNQIGTALDTLNAKEDVLVRSYREKGGALLATIAELEPKRDAYVAQIPVDVLEHYHRLLKGKQGVAVAHLHDESCDACRAHIGQAYLVELRAHAPLGVCPQCGRLMVVE